MEAKILVRTTYHTDPYTTLLQDSTVWFPEENKSDSLFFPFLQTIVCLLIGLFTFYVLYCTIRWIYIQFIQSDTIYNRENCPICLNEFTAPIRVNCGHAFCIECLLSYFTNNPTVHNCPLCRDYIRDFQCLNNFAFEDTEQAQEGRLEEELRNCIIQQNIIYNTLTVLETKDTIFLIVIFFLSSYIIYCIVQVL